MPEKRIVLMHCGTYDPKKIGGYLERDGFKALEKAMAMTPDQVIAEIKSSELRGRGGAGFPAGMKWELTRKSPGDEKYILCNADEGEVGTFKDRHILQNDPFSLVEAIAIAGYAIGAKQGYIYLRTEYHFLLDLIRGATAQAKEKGYLKHMDISVYEGAGAYVCGEESALMESIEGKRGEVRYRPPFPPTKGLWAKPTVINNVETLMNIPRIILNGADWFKKIGTEKSKGTKVFSVCGDVKRPAVYELVLGSPLKELMDLAQAESIKAIQIGGATGRLIPGALIDTPLAFENILGAGSVIVMNESRDMVDIVYRTMEFLAEESCGKCTPCREGTQVILQIMERFMHSEGTMADIKILEELSETMILSSLCGLGQAAPVPVVDSLRYFKNEYESRMKTKVSGVKK